MPGIILFEPQVSLHLGKAAWPLCQRARELPEEVHQERREGGECRRRAMCWLQCNLQKSFSWKVLTLSEMKREHPEAECPIWHRQARKLDRSHTLQPATYRLGSVPDVASDCFRGGLGVVWLFTLGDERLSLVSSPKCPKAHVQSTKRRPVCSGQNWLHSVDRLQFL